MRMSLHGPDDTLHIDEEGVGAQEVCPQDRLRDVGNDKRPLEDLRTETQGNGAGPKRVDGRAICGHQ